MLRLCEEVSNVFFERGWYGLGGRYCAVCKPVGAGASFSNQNFVERWMYSLLETVISW